MGYFFSITHNTCPLGKTDAHSRRANTVLRSSPWISKTSLEGVTCTLHDFTITAKNSSSKSHVVINLVEHSNDLWLQKDCIKIIHSLQNIFTEATPSSRSLQSGGVETGKHYNRCNYNTDKECNRGMNLLNLEN